MDPVTASQIYVASLFLVFGFGETRLAQHVWFSLLALIILVGGPIWFAYVTGMWPFYFVGAATLMYFVRLTIATIREAKDNAINQS